MCLKVGFGTSFGMLVRRQPTRSHLEKFPMLGNETCHANVRMFLEFGRIALYCVRVETCEQRICKPSAHKEGSFVVWLICDDCTLILCIAVLKLQTAAGFCKTLLGCLDCSPAL